MAITGFNFRLIHDAKKVGTRCGNWSFLPRKGDIITIEGSALEVTSVVIDTAKSGDEVALHSYAVRVKPAATPTPNDAVSEHEFAAFVKAIK